MTAQIRHEQHIARFTHWVLIIVTVFLLTCTLALATMTSRPVSFGGPRHAAVNSGTMASLNWGSRSCGTLASLNWGSPSC
jgi:hypothetical protein